MRKMRGPVLNNVSGELKTSLFTAPGRSAFRARSERGPIGTATRRFRKASVAWQAQHFRKVRCRFHGRRGQGEVQISWSNICRGRHSTFARSSADFVAGAALSQSQVQISWQGQHFRKVRSRSRRSTFARSGTDFVSGAARLQGRRSTFTRSNTQFVAGAELSHGRAQSSWQAQHFRKVRGRYIDR